MSENLFGNYLQYIREERGIVKEALCEGICTERFISRIECGEMVPDSMLQNALLERLGVGEENYEQYLDIEDYERWEAGMKILNAIVYEDWSAAERYLATYQCRKNYDAKNNLEKQFVLSMHALIQRNAGANAEKLREIFKEAVALTMPEAEYKSVHDMVLSLKELNLLLEWEQYREDRGRRERYLEIMSYVEEYFDPIGIAKIYPKAVCLLCNCKEEIAVKELRGYCDKALEYLRDTSRIYFMWEILGLREKFLKRQIDGLRVNSRDIMEDLCEKLEQTELWKKALEDSYEEFRVRKDTYEYCYLYVLKGVHSIGDVVKIRRKMLGLSREALVGEGSVKTLKRMEEKKNNPQWRTMVKVFTKLGLPAEYARNTLRTENHQTKKQMAKLMRYINEKRWEEADNLFREIRKEVSEEDKFNLQVLMQKEAVIKFRLSEIGKEEYLDRMRAALELTLPLEAFLKEGEKYLTNQEQTCILNLMQAMDANSECFKKCIKQFEECLKRYIERGFLQTEDDIHSVVMAYIASELGNSGRYEDANEYDEIIVQGYLRFRKLRMLSLALYDRWWNDEECVKKGIHVNREKSNQEELMKIAQLAYLDKQERRFRRYLAKIDRL